MLLNHYKSKNKMDVSYVTTSFLFEYSCSSLNTKENLFWNNQNEIPLDEISSQLFASKDPDETKRLISLLGFGGAMCYAAYKAYPNVEARFEDGSMKGFLEYEEKFEETIVQDLKSGALFGNLEKELGKVAQFGPDFIQFDNVKISEVESSSGRLEAKNISSSSNLTNDADLLSKTLSTVPSGQVLNEMIFSSAVSKTSGKSLVNVEGSEKTKVNVGDVKFENHYHLTNIQNMNDYGGGASKNKNESILPEPGGNAHIASLVANTLGEISETVLHLKEKLENLYHLESRIDDKERQKMSFPDTKNFTETNFDEKVTLAASYIKSGKVDDYQNMVENISDMIQKASIPNGVPLARYKGKKLKKEGKYLESIVVFRIASKAALSLDKVSTTDLDHIQNCAARMITAMKKIDNTDLKNSVNKSFVIPGIKNVIVDLSQLESKSDSVYLRHVIAWCYKCIGSASIFAENYENAANEMKIGVKLMEDTFLETANKKRVYGLLLSSTGSALSKQDKYEEAVKYLSKADKAIKSSEDWNDEEDKMNSITSNSLALAKVSIYTQDGDDNIEVLNDILKQAATCFEVGDMENYGVNISTAYEIAEDSGEIDQLLGVKMQKLAKKHFKEKSYALSFVTAQMTSKAFLKDPFVSNVNINVIQHAVGQMTQCGEKLISEGQQNTILVTDYIIPAIQNAINDIKQMPGGDYEVRMHNVAWCYKCLSSTYANLKEHGKSIEALKEGLSVLNATFPENPGKFKIAAMLKHSIAITYTNIDDHETGVEWFIKAKATAEDANNWDDDEEEKQKFDRINTHNLTAAKLNAKGNTGSIQNMEGFNKDLNAVVEAVKNNSEDYKTKFQQFSNTAAVLDDPAASLLNIGNDFIEKKEYLNGIFVYLVISHVLPQHDFVDNSTLDIIQNAIARIVVSLSKLLKQNPRLKFIVNKFIVPEIEQVILYLKNLQNCDHQIQQKSISWCFKHLTAVYVSQKMPEKAIKSALSSLRTMKNCFGENYNDHHVVFFSKLDLGQIYLNSNDQEKASKWFIAAQKAFEAAKDWDDEDQRKNTEDMVREIVKLHAEIVPSTSDECKQQ